MKRESWRYLLLVRCGFFDLSDSRNCIYLARRHFCRDGRSLLNLPINQGWNDYTCDELKYWIPWGKSL